MNNRGACDWEVSGFAFRVTSLARTRNQKLGTRNFPIRPKPFGVAINSKPRKEPTMKLKTQPTQQQIDDLKKLAKAMKSASKAKALKKRLESFRDDNADALNGNGIEIEGLNVRVKVTRELIVEEA